MTVPDAWPSVEARLVTPEEAAGLLGALPVQPERGSERALVRRYADVMRRREWLVSGETVVLDADGSVLDGLRRLRAAVLSETGFPGLIVRLKRNAGGNADAADLADVIDAGRRRSFADIVSIDHRSGDTGTDEGALRRAGWVVAFVHKLLGGGPVASEQLRLMRLERRFRANLPAALEFADTFSRRLPLNGPADLTLAAVFCLIADLRGPMGIALLEDVLSGPQIALYRRLVKPYAGSAQQRLWAQILLGHALTAADLDDGLAGLRADVSKDARNEATATGPDPRDPAAVSPEWFVVTPLIAKALLRKMAPNRRVGKAAVDAYAEAMTRGGWRLTGQSIKVDALGRMFDGQHRCTAAVKAGTSFPSLVVSNLAPEVFPTLDMARRERRPRGASA